MLNYLLGRGMLSCCELDVRDANDEIIYKITASWM